VFAVVYLAGENRAHLVPLLFLVLWQVHYAYRAFVYPFSLRGGKRIPVTIMLMAIAFNLLNATVNAMAVSVIGDYRTSWLVDPRFLAGVALFVAGLAINRSADRTLRGLRAPGESGYKVPTGGVYRWISCPNYFGEIVQWCGWALATWSLGGLAFAVYTTANLAPRALDHHRWYRDNFPDYPPGRRALVPFVV
jgi:protein-S-isoprenylcysteine O-methyltransferase Ste14